jgi:predicted AAA+ superfamily ATPase
MGMKRKIYQDMLRWKHERKGDIALLIEGARRIGKSYIVEEFARNEYDSYLLIDFSKVSPQVLDVFNIYLDDLNTLFLNLEIYFKRKLTPRNSDSEEAHSLVIFDEVQFCPRARAAIKHLVIDHRYDYIETGSLISIKKNVKNIMLPSEEHAIEMFPMDFEEFVWALGDEVLMPFIRQQFEKHLPVGSFHRRAMDYFRQYLIVGGMPQSVAKYVETHDFDKVDEVKRDIIALYRNDIQKYADNQETKVAAIFEEIPGQLQKHEKKFQLSALQSQARMRDYSEAFFWLSDAKIINCCYNSTEPSIGLKLNEERTTLKCYMADTGLLISLAFDERGIMGEDLYKKLMFDKLEVNEGMLIENIVAQMLRASGHRLYFYSKNSATSADDRMEIDFLIAKRGTTSRHNISPIEVKSGNKYTLTSLKKCIAKYGNQLSTPYVLHDKDVKEMEGIVYLPLYMTPLL